MIRVKLVTEPEYRQMAAQVRTYDESNFYDLLRRDGENAFQDFHSKALIRGLHGEAAVTGLRHLRRTPEGNLCLPALSNEAKYGLVILDNSAHGLYTLFDREFGEFEAICRMEESIGPERPETLLVWDVLSRLDTDILLVFRKRDFNYCWDIPLDNPFILENYRREDAPPNAHSVPAYVEEDWLTTPYEQDGILHVGNFFYHQMYRWQDDPRELLQVIKNLLGTTVLLEQPDQWYTIAEFSRALYSQNRCPLFSEDEEDAVYENGILPFSKDLRIRNHMTHTPSSPDHRRIPYLIISHRADGRYELRGDISIKWPCYEEIFEEALNLRAPDGETFLLALNRDEIPRCAEDLEHAICSFQMKGDEIELFGKIDALAAFGELLQEMLASGQGWIDGTVDGQDEDGL